MMTNRTATLGLLFVAATIASGVLLGALLPSAVRVGVATPWLAPLVTWGVFTAVLFMGRQNILPASAAAAPVRALATLLVMVGGAMLVATVVAAALGAVLGSDVPGPAPLAVLLFLGLWLGLGVWHRTHARRQAPLP